MCITAAFSTGFVDGFFVLDFGHDSILFYFIRAEKGVFWMFSYSDR